MGYEQNQEIHRSPDVVEVSVTSLIELSGAI